jgi:hypothetical protein
MYLAHQHQLQYVLASAPAWRAAGLLEKRLCKHFQKRFAIAVGDVHQAVLAVALATDIRPGDEVIVSPLEARGVSALSLCGATLVPAIMSAPDLLIEYIWLRKVLSARTRMLLVPNTGGLAVDHATLREGLRHTHDVSLVALTSLGMSDPCGMPSGSDADIVLVDIGPGKAITAGQGAVILLDDRALFERLLRAVAPIERQWDELGDATPCTLNSTLPVSASLMVHNTWEHQWDRLRDKQQRYTKALAFLDEVCFIQPFTRAGACAFEDARLSLRPGAEPPVERCTLRYVHEEPGPHLPVVTWRVPDRTNTLLRLLKKHSGHVKAEAMIAEKWLYC